MQSMIGMILTLLIFVGVQPAGADEAASKDDGGATASVSLEASAKPEAKEDGPPKDLPFYRGSALSYRNTVSAISFNKDAEPDYNPYYLMTFGIAPRFWTGEKGYLNLNIDISREITESDWTTQAGETILGDISFGAGLANLYKIPVLGIGISTSVSFIVPSSKGSQARTMILGIKPGLSLSRRFDVLSGLSLGYNLGATKTFHEYTTVQREDSMIEDIKQSAIVNTRTMASYMNTGVRNASWGLTNMFTAGLEFVSWLGMGINVGVAHSFLYEFEDDYEGLYGEDEVDISYENTDASNVRYTMIYGADLHSTPIPSLSISLGASTANPMLSPDSTYESPFVNRYTAIYLDLRLDIAGLVSQLTSSEE
jgi:hypothetical protein